LRKEEKRMKMTKKKVFVVALAVCLIAILSFGTLAWFTATDKVDNIFQVSTDSEQKPDFKLDIFEHKADENGKVSDDEVATNTYDNVAPGDKLFKDPTVRNDGQYDMWVRVSVTLDDYSKWEAILGDGYDFSAILTGVSADLTLDSTTVGTNTLVYYKNAKLAVGETSTLFTGVKIPGKEFTVANIPTAFNMTIVADAIQYDNTCDTAEETFQEYWQ
jgi:predicted ribosomally synthesized peptide with SipW-like signal peptide